MRREDPAAPALTTLRESDSATAVRPEERPESATAMRPVGPRDSATSMRPREPGDSATSMRPGEPRGSATSMRAGEPASRGGTAEVHVGSLIKGRFELKVLVGRGGMGMVFSALDHRKLEARDPNPDVAVKVLNSSFQQHTDSFVALEREASKAQSLAHPNIVTVFDFDRDGENVFITMELLRGRSLEDVIRAARDVGLERKAALPVIRGIAEGLSYAHRKGIVHSDLKPANVFLVDDGTPKLLDFGIARAVPAVANAGPQDDFDAGSLGAYTPLYATEEMVQGADPAPADDMYAFGMIAYELLTGRHPFGGKTAAEARAAGLTPAPIRTLSRREWRILARTLAFDRDKRLPDATEFLRLFFGATRLRNSLIAATLVLVAVSGYLWYRNYQQSGPDIAFDALPAATQLEVKQHLADGDKEWTFYAQQGIADALNGSLKDFADAYQLHKRDREAVRGLKRAADELLKRARSDPALLREQARNIEESSEFFKTYEPVTDAAGP
jgi:serine/threonine protein kinase